MEKKKTTVKSESKRKCFIITPIGNETDPIRRHIDGLINECIIPAIGEKYECIASHQMNDPGSISNSIINEIFESDIVIANITGFNPNVMYELAFRHSINKPVIIIKLDDGEPIPFDTHGERTIFYQNDFQGTSDLRKKISQMVTAIEANKYVQKDNPIVNALNSAKLSKRVKQITSVESENDSESKLILKMLGELQKEMKNIKSNYSHLEFRNRGSDYMVDLFIQEGTKINEYTARFENNFMLFLSKIGISGELMQTNNSQGNNISFFIEDSDEKDLNIITNYLRNDKLVDRFQIFPVA